MKITYKELKEKAHKALVNELIKVKTPYKLACRIAEKMVSSSTEKELNTLAN